MITTHLNVDTCKLLLWIDSLSHAYYNYLVMLTGMPVPAFAHLFKKNCNACCARARKFTKWANACLLVCPLKSRKYRAQCHRKILSMPGYFLMSQIRTNEVGHLLSELSRNWFWNFRYQILLSKVSFKVLDCKIPISFPRQFRE